jgi:ABC-type branched-subunit amino acid transport system substrate-binding protein
MMTLIVPSLGLGRLTMTMMTVIEVIVPVVETVGAAMTPTTTLALGLAVTTAPEGMTATLPTEVLQDVTETARETVLIATATIATTTIGEIATETAAGIAIAQTETETGIGIGTVMEIVIVTETEAVIEEIERKEDLM